MKRPFDFLTSLSLSVLQKSKENFDNNFKHLDSILVWVLGFAIAGITFIASNVSEISVVYSKATLKTILLLLACSILFGIIFRLSAFMYLRKFQDIIFYFEGAFVKGDMMQIEHRKLEGKSIQAIAKNLLDDFKADYSDIVELYNIAESEQRRNELLKYLIQEHRLQVEHNKTEYDFSINYLKETLMEGFGLSKKSVEKEFSKNHKIDSNLLKMWGIFSLLFLFLTFANFLGVIFILYYNF